VIRPVGGCVLLLAAGGCGAAARVPVAPPQTQKLDWHENCGTHADRIPITTHRLVVRRGRWRVDLSFRNQTRVGLNIIRPHFPGGTYFGLEPFKTSSLREVRQRTEAGSIKPRTLADRFSPQKPALLPSGRGWSGSFSGPGDLPAEVPIRVVLGRFVPLGPVPPGFVRGFLCISERAVRLR